MTMAPAAPVGTQAPYDELQAIAEKVATGRLQVTEIMRYCDVLLGLGLAEAVEGFLRGINVSHPQWQNYQATTRTRLKSLPTGLISWTSRQRRYHANLQTLLARWPEYEALLTECATGAARYQLHLARDGNYQLRDLANPNPLEGWSGGLRDQKAIVSLWTHEHKEGELDLASPAAFDGAGFGWLLLRVLETTRNSYLNYSPAAYIVEPDPLGIWMLLHMHDLREWLAHPRTHLFLGPAAKEAFAAFLARGTHTLPNYSYFNPLTARPTCDLVALVAAEFKQRGERTAELRQDVAGIYAGRTPEWWQDRYESATSGRGKPLKIIGLTSRFTTVLRYSMEELAQAFEAAGHEFHLSMEADDGTLQRTDLQLIRNVQPDLLIQISRMRWENTAIPPSIPFLSWDQDYLPGMRAPESRHSLNHLTYVAGHAAAHGYHAPGEHARWPARNCIFSHPAAATHRYSAQPMSDDLIKRHACDFSYVSNAADSPEDFARYLGTFWEKHLPSALWKDLVTQVLSEPEVNGDVAHWSAAISAAASRHGLRPPADTTDIALSLIKIADRRFRHEALHWVADYCRKTGATLRLYGAGWEKNRAFSAFACGPIEPGLPMRALFQATRINLQMILSGFLHSRSLDGLAAGGFFLTRYSPADYDPDPRAPEFYLMARRALDLGIWNFQQLVASDDPVIAARREQFYVDQVRALQLKDFECFYVAGELATAATVFPEIPAITFRSAEGFHALAEKYLHDRDAWESVRRQLHETVKLRFSYDARVKTFLQRITRGFTYPT